jgi:hypothetical protein
MKLLSWFLPAMALSSASAAASVGGGRSMGALRDAARHDGVDQRAARGLADDGQHGLLVLGRQADVAGDEFAGVFKIVQGRGGSWRGKRRQCFKYESCRRPSDGRKRPIWLKTAHRRAGVRTHFTDAQSLLNSA